MKSVLPVTLLLLCSVAIPTFQYPQQILYVQRSNNSQCPADIQITECQTLDWFIEHFNTSFTSNTKMLFEEGRHTLKNSIIVNTCHNFIMIGNGSAEYSSDGLPQPTSRIHCDEASSAGFFFLNSSNISIKNLELKFCSGLNTYHNWHNISASLIFDSVQNISLDQVVVSNAKGHALYTKDIFDSNYVVNSAFLNSSKHQTFSQSGNARFNFSAHVQHSFTSLVLNSSWFMYGETSVNHSVAGGLIIDIDCLNIHVTLVNVTAKGNTGGLGGNVAIFLIIFNVNSSSIVIKNSHIIDGYASKGGGLAFWSKQSYTFINYNTFEKHSFDRNILTICDTVFYKNSALNSSGAMYMAHYSHDTTVSHLKHITITNCTFTENGGNGSSVDIKQHSLQPMTPFLNTTLVMCSFKNNILANDGAILTIYSDKVSMTNCTFTDNNATAISLSSAYLNLYGNIFFENNTGKLGGAMKINEASLIFISNGTHVRFVNNRAKEKGGAIFVKTSCMDSSVSTVVCFIQPAPPYNMTISEFTKLMTLEFVNNSAKISGDALYGGHFDRCSTTLPYSLNKTQPHKFFSYSVDIFNGIFDITQQHGRSKAVSSDPHKVYFCNKSLSSKSYTSTTEIKTYPGQNFTVSVVTIGQMESPSRGRINASLLNEVYPNHRLFRVSRPIQTDKCGNLTYVLKSNKSHAQLTFAPETAGVYCNIGMAKLTVHLLPCPLGFQLTHSTPYIICSCDPLLSKFLTFNLQVTCSINNQTISVPQKAIWFGCFDPEQQNQSSLTCDSLIVAQDCGHYCSNAEDNSTTVEVPLINLDKQCSDGHTGIMCGTCKPGYSRVLGDLMKCQKGCTYTNLPIILLAFLISGILLLVIIRFLNLTVTEGTINGLLVYTMVMQTHHSYFSENLSAFGQVCWVFISWINLTLGIKACFYRGMDGYEQIWTLFGQAFFSFLFLFTIILLGRKFIFFTRLLGRNIIKVLATLVAMMYFNLLFATFVTFQYAVLHISTTNGTQYSKTVWYYDGSIPYLGLKHTPLFVTALICSLLILYLILSLLFIQCLQKRSELPCLRWVERLRPFYEAYTGPCRDHYRFWPGFLFFVRTGLFIMNSLIPSHIDTFFKVKMLITAVVFVLIISLACISPQGVYKKWPVNILEFSFYLNLCITSGYLGLNYNKQKKASAVYTSVSIAALTFFGIMVYNCYSQVKNTKVWKKLTIWTSVRVRFVHNHTKPDSESDDFESEECDERDQLLPQALPPVIRFEHLREPLVEA